MTNLNCNEDNCFLYENRCKITNEREKLIKNLKKCKKHQLIFTPTGIERRIIEKKKLFSDRNFTLAIIEMIKIA